MRPTFDDGKSKVNHNTKTIMNKKMGSFRGKGKETGLEDRSFHDDVQAMKRTHSSYYYNDSDKVIITKDARGVDVKLVKDRRKNHMQLVKAIMSMNNDDNNDGIVPDDSSVSFPDPRDQGNPNIFYLGSDGVHINADETDKNGSWRKRRRRRLTGNVVVPTR
jgi:hypothetical protein